MTVSTTTTFNLSSDELVNAALRKLAVLGDGQSPTTTQLTNGTQTLNAMLKTFMVKGMPLWAISEYSLTMTATATYTFGIGQTVNIPAPLKVTEIIRVTTADGNRVPMNVKSHYDYNLLSNITTTGVPTTYWYEPLNQTGVLHLWPKPDATTIAGSTLLITYQRPFFDMVAGANTLDFPQWWHEAVVYGLASRLAPEYGIPLQDRSMYQKEAEYFLQEALSFGTEEGSLFLQPDWISRGK